MRLTVILNEPEADALRRVAIREDHAPRDQARRILREGLARDGGLEDDSRLTDAASREPEAAAR